MSRLERLLKLAQKTGDTLIIHDKDGSDKVIMDVSMYEVLHDMYGMGRYDDMRDGCDDCGHHAMRDDDVDYTMPFESEAEDAEEHFEDNTDWYRAGDILHDRRRNDFVFDDEDDFDMSDEIHVEDIPSHFFDEDEELEPMGAVDHVLSEEQFVEPEEPLYDDLGEASISQVDRKDIPFIPQEPLVDVLDEHPIDDDEEPVFFEEPV